MNFIIYAMCPDCMVMHGPFASDAQRGQFYSAVHADKCVGIRQIPKAHREAVAKSKFGTPAAVTTEIGGVKVTTPTMRNYLKGDYSPPFKTRYDGDCYECGRFYRVGEDIRMVTIKDGQKGKAVHEHCLDSLIDSLLDVEPQSEGPPF